RFDSSVKVVAGACNGLMVAASRVAPCLVIYQRNCPHGSVVALAASGSSSLLLVACGRAPFLTAPFPVVALLTGWLGREFPLSGRTATRNWPSADRHRKHQGRPRRAPWLPYR